MKIERAIITGGGSGGHVFPAIAIADEIKRRNPDVDILFVGAEGKMEMEKVPDAGYQIIGLQIVGFQRKFTFSNFLLPFKIIKSLLKARKIVKDFNPQIAVGVGGYASGPTLKAATMLKIPAVVQEQNSFPGKTNKILSKSVSKICVAYTGLDRFFPKEKIVMTGNPTRKDMVDTTGKESEGYRFYDFDATKKTILIVGGSLGARTLNESVINKLEELKASGAQVLWQCGKLYHEKLRAELENTDLGCVKMVQFIHRMDLAYAIADVVISRAGAMSVSELCLVKKPIILVPSPNVAEDHQTKNAMALVNNDAAVLVTDATAKENLIPRALALLTNQTETQKLITQIGSMGKPNATADIVDVLEKLI
ncbi:MAG: undecaprenyldiphospho-muramoylpentapeptide beta-N-acetylglucosaminyltransferase [Crocinitomicaceae bacterium]|nr:undecaprenyldiphospho-muramoylpentapeptide beta-N-acetylglucosaminyltransferase [Crocinitomicaceae bacterium]MDG1777677.1 undecaprenyldiphospho-muramoylpentapeptide beta-N-acetylglucosaminyltransferase [Crocinitomicaceae bacterium]